MLLWQLEQADWAEYSIETRGGKGRSTPPSLTAARSLFMGRLQYGTCIFNEASPDRGEDRFARIRDEALQLIWVFEESFMRIFASNLWSRDIKNNLLVKKKEKKVICPHCGRWIPASATCRDFYATVHSFVFKSTHPRLSRRGHRGVRTLLQKARRRRETTKGGRPACTLSPAIPLCETRVRIR